MEDWWLVRDAQGQVGWLLSGRADVDVPDTVAQYAEGQRIVASFVLSEVTVPDADSPGNVKKVPQFAVLMTEPKDGLPYDFNQLREMSTKSIVQSGTGKASRPSSRYITPASRLFEEGTEPSGRTRRTDLPGLSGSRGGR